MNQPLTYKDIFGQDFELGFNLEEFNFLVDESKDGALCPEFSFFNKTRKFSLKVDFENKDDRIVDDYRYILELCEHDNNEEECYYFGTESSESIKRKLKDIKRGIL